MTTPEPPAPAGAPWPAPRAVTVATTGAEWDAYVASRPDATCDHRWAWRRVFERALGHRCVYLVARHAADGPLCGVLPVVLVRSLLFGRVAISVPFLNYGGVLADDADTALALVAAARDEAARFGATHLELRHAERQTPHLPYREHKVGMALALPDAAPALWETIDRKIRNQVRKAQKEGLTVVTGGRELLDDFYAVFTRNMRDLGTPVLARRVFVEVLDAFGDAASIAVVRRGTTAMAAGFVVRSGATVINPWASSLREFRALCPNVLLYWAMLERAIESGAAVFDFGRSTAGSGPHQFKRQWGAAERRLHWEYVLLSRSEAPRQGPDNPKFAKLIALWQRLPVPIANALGTVLSRHLP